MALATLSPVLSELRGLSGSAVAKNIHGNTVIRRTYRQFKTPDNKTTPQKNAFYQIIKLWATLSPEQQSAWNSLSSEIIRSNRVGYKTTLNGFNLFCSCNLNIISNGYYPVLIAPSIALNSFPAFSFSIVNSDTSSLIFKFTCSDSFPHFIRVFASVGVSVGVSHVPLLRLANVTAAVSGDLVEMSSFWYFVFNQTPEIPFRIFLSFQLVELFSGFASFKFPLATDILS